mmetsp:Transcript_132062/g.312995  ORF Transcript_132062/g.312995 Transcript_132062/m.312995 type:complete len:881 (-) Transcript_132062:76-2718(-)
MPQEQEDVPADGDASRVADVPEASREFSQVAAPEQSAAADTKPFVQTSEDAARKPPQQTLSRGESLLQSLTASLEAMSPSLQALSERDEENDILGDLPQVLQRMRSSGEDALAASTEPLAAQAESSIVESLRQSRQDRQAEPSPSLPRKLEESAAASPPRSETGILRDADSRSSSKDSSADSRFPSKSRFPDSRSQSKDAKNVTGKATASRAASHRAARFDRDDLKRISEEMQDRFVEKMEHFTLVARMARLEESLENQLGREGFVTAEIEDLKMENRYHVEEKQKLQQQLEEIREATAGNTCRIRDDQHRLENAADHAYRTAKHLEEVSSNFSVTKEVLGEDIGRMAKAVQVLANEFRIIEEEHRRVEQQKAHELKIAGHAIKELQEQIGKQEVQSGAMESDLIQVKQQFGTYAKQAGVQRLEKRILDMQEETGRLQEFVHEKFLTIQDAERREMMSAFAAKWDPYNKSRLLRKTVDGWVEFLRRQNRSREALQSVKQIYAKTHVTARLRSWWYLMQRDHTDSQFKHLSENLETQEAKLEGARGALLRHEKATTEQARSLQYRVLAVEKGLEAAEKEKATREELLERFEDINYRLREELSLDPIRADLANIKIFIQKLKEDKVDVQDIAADREKVRALSGEFRAWLMRHDESLKRKAELTENDTKADARGVEQVLVLLAKQADHLATMVAHDLDQLRQALTRFLEISPDFRKASLSIGFEPHEQCVACRALPRKCVNDAVAGADGTIYKLGMETTITAAEETQRVLAEKLRYPPTLAINAYVGCTNQPGNSIQDADVSVQPLPLLQKVVTAEAGWLSGKELFADRVASSRKVVEDVCVPVPARSRRRPPSAQESRERPSVRAYFPAVGPRGAGVKPKGP